VGFLFAPVMVTFGMLIVLRSVNHRYGWLMLAGGFSIAANDFVIEYHRYALLVAPEAGLPLGLLAAWVHDLYMIPLALFFCLLILFPDGNLPSRSWRWAFWPTMAGWSLFALVFAFLKRPVSFAELYEEFGIIVPNPFGFIPYSRLLLLSLQGLFIVLLPISILTGLASLIIRYRGASREVRQQIKWVLYFFIMVLVVMMLEYVQLLLLEVVGIDPGVEEYLSFILNLLLAGAGAALGVAIFKYRLYDIDLIINRTLVYGGLTAAIVLGYVLLVSGLGALLPGEVGVLPSIIATAVLAVLFAPLKDRLQRAANRLVFGERQRPYEVIRTLGARLESAAHAEGVLPAIVETIARSLKFPYVSIGLDPGDGPDLAAEYGRRRRDAVDFPLYDQATFIANLSVCPRDGEQEMAEVDRELLRQVALWLGPVAHASLLAKELRASHARLVSASAEERRRLYRDLHDGLGPALASQTLRFDRALELLPEDPQGAVEILQQLKKQTQGLVLEIRRLVYDLRSSALDELGLLGSLKEAVEGFRGSANGLSISLEGDEQALRGLPAAHEQAAERIVLEGLTNAVRHANANRCRLSLEVQEHPRRELQLTIEDDGRGVLPGASPGVGIVSMIERAEALGGRVRVEPNQPCGTRVVATLPLPYKTQPSERV
jgi:signal transduction histidine kinase